MCRIPYNSDVAFMKTPCFARPINIGRFLGFHSEPPFWLFFDPHQELARMRERGCRARCALVCTANAMATQDNPV
jgi:hypothetical protein